MAKELPLAARELGTSVVEDGGCQRAGAACLGHNQAATFPEARQQLLTWCRAKRFTPPRPAPCALGPTQHRQPKDGECPSPQDGPGQVLPKP